MIIRKAGLDDIPRLRQVFSASISQSCAKDYSPPQIEAWLSKALLSPERWKSLISGNEVYVLEAKSQIAGFGSINSSGLIDMFYLHPAIQGKGYARQLYLELEKQAHLYNQAELHSHVSVTARGFFKKMGFDKMKVQSVLINGVELCNYRMSKQLSNEQKT